MRKIHELVRAVPLDGITRIDVGMEGDWSGSVQTVWTRAGGFSGFDEIVREHPVQTPSVELYFHGAWLGVHCFRVEKGRKIFDEDLAEALIHLVEARLSATSNGPDTSGPRIE